MVKLKISVEQKATLKRLQAIKKALSSGEINKLQARMAQRSLNRLVLATPKGWTGHTRQSWTVIKRFGQGYLVTNTSKVMLFLEKGTKAHGPVRAKFLFIPLTRRAAIGGWSPGMQFGVDFVLAKRVRGIKAMRIVARERKAIQAEYLTEAEKMVRGAVS